MTKPTTLYADNNILKEFYGCLNTANASRNSQNAFSGMYLPHSDVFYVQQALMIRTNRCIPLREVELRMKENGWNPGEK
tara:strand:- start:90 stop:326 length:237 start_codon:yes stop_codon:yes gene_type:complete